MLCCVASSPLSTVANIYIPCSVNTYGIFLIPPQLEVTNCDFKFSSSSFVNWNIKSSGNRSIFRFTCWVFRLPCPCCPAMWKPIGDYKDYKKSRPNKAGLRPAKRLWAWYGFDFIFIMIKPIEGGFRFRNVGFLYSGILVSGSKNIHVKIRILHKNMSPLFWVHPKRCMPDMNAEQMNFRFDILSRSANYITPLQTIFLDCQRRNEKE